MTGTDLPKGDIRQDGAIQKLLERMPPAVQQSFTEEQLAHLRVALGARQWGRHKLDWRGTLGFGRWRYYYVVVAGRNLRDGARQGQLSLLMQSLLLSLLVVICTLFGLLLLYLLKSALGIDLFDDFSLGIWDWFRQL